MRLRYKEWAIPELQDNKLIFFDPVDLKGKWKQEFANSNPIHLEIGAGKGRFATTMAERNPDINFVAVEMEAGAFVYASRLFSESEQENIRGIRTLAQKLLDYFEEQEVDKIYINFCNPWPKNRQHKRRLTHPRQLEIYKKILKENSTIDLKTDDLDFFKDSIDYFEKTGFEITELDYNLSADKDGNIVTEYESKWRSQGVDIKFLRARWPGGGENT